MLTLVALHVVLHIAASGAVSASSSNTIVTVVYVLTGISLVAGFIVGTWKYVQRQKKKWTEEGITRQKQSQAVEENTEQMKKNTLAIDNLSVKFGEFATSMRYELNGLGERIGKLEVWRHRAEHGEKDEN